jgi:predicted glutamine amidotransferase
MCEILAVKWPEPRPFAAVAGWARAMEHYGSGRFGWGVAWLEEGGSATGGRVRVHVSTGQMAADEAVADALGAVRSTAFLVHLRRPTLLSTEQLADTQPFITEERDLAFCHNGRFSEQDTFRPAYAGRLTGSADSQIGFCMLQDIAREGASICDALAVVHAKLGGNANMATLDSRGVVALYSAHETNRFWTFRTGEAQVAATELHSPDDSLFTLVFSQAADRAVVDQSVLLCEPETQSERERETQ